MIGGKPKLKEKLIEKNLNESDEQFIFYNNHKEKKFQQQIEVQAILNSNNCHKVMVIIDKKSTIDYLCMKIAEQMEKFQEYANLEGLKAVNLTKRTEKGMVRIPNSGELKDNLIGGDIIYCDLNTQEYWVKTNIKIISNFSKMNIHLDLKISLETIFKKLKFLLIKLATNFWIDYSRGQDDSLHYAFINAKFKTLQSKNNFEFNINDLNKSNFIESMKIKDVFDFNSVINCTVNLISLEELLFEELKNGPIDTCSNNKLRWNEFTELTFDMLRSNKKFIPESIFINKYIKRLIESNIKRSKNSFYIYNRHFMNKEISNNIIDDDELINSFNGSANLIIGPETFYSICGDDDERKMSPDKMGTKKSLGTGNESEYAVVAYDSGKESSSSDDTDKKLRKLSGKSFLEHSKMINDFQSMNAHQNNENSSAEGREFSLGDSQYSNLMTNRFNKKGSSIDDSVLYIHPKSKKILSSNIIPDLKFIGMINEREISLNISRQKSDRLTLENNQTICEEEKGKFEEQTFKKGSVFPRKSFLHPQTTNSQKFTSLFSKMRDTSQYSNLCSEFRAHLRQMKFLEVMNSYSTLKLCKNTLERVCIPQFRDINIQSEAVDIEVKHNSSFKNEEESPISVNNKRILLFILILITIFLGAILCIFLS